MTTEEIKSWNKKLSDATDKVNNLENLLRKDFLLYSLLSKSSSADAEFSGYI